MSFVTYEDLLDRDRDWALREGSMHFEKHSAVHETLRRIAWIPALALIIGCIDRTDSPMRSRLEQAVASEVTSFDFAADSNFDWDHKFVFDCYTSRKTVEDALGFRWPDYERSAIQHSDGVVLIVFVRDDRVVHWYEQPRWIELGGLACDEGYHRTNAKFQISRRDGRVQLIPEAIPES
jgi:hypothetical protein